MGSDGSNRRDVEPPPGFEVMRSSDLDPLFGTFDRWAYRGRVGERTRIRSGLESRAAACRAAWEAYGDA
jgi:hypothetical protein